LRAPHYTRRLRKNVKTVMVKLSHNERSLMIVPMYILLVASSASTATMKTAGDLTAAALGRGHKVSLFFNGESVRLLEAGKMDSDVAYLASQGVRLLACITSARERGITSPDGLAEGAEMSSLGELVELMDDSDRVLFIG
jgi:sulfur relay (sulfurtransferase) complex TusBCD TusD component (DsrE family)